MGGSAGGLQAAGVARRVAGSGGAVSRGGPYLAVRAKFQEINWVGGCLLVVPTPQRSSLYVKRPKNNNKNKTPPFLLTLLLGYSK